VFTIEKWRGDKGDKELAAISVGTGVGHTQQSWFVVGQITGKFTGIFVAWVASAGARRVTTLDHKTRNDPMENQVVIETLLSEKDRAGGMHGCGCMEQAKSHLPHVSGQVPIVIGVGVEGHHLWLG